jgi:hypothetical protein
VLRERQLLFLIFRVESDVGALLRRRLHMLGAKAATQPMLLGQLPPCFKHNSETTYETKCNSELYSLDFMAYTHLKNVRVGDG